MIAVVQSALEQTRLAISKWPIRVQRHTTTNLELEKCKRARTDSTGNLNMAEEETKAAEKLDLQGEYTGKIHSIFKVSMASMYYICPP